MSADVLEMEKRAEARRIAERRADAIARHPATLSKQCPPHAALLHRLASLITTEDLPWADLHITAQREITVDLSGSELVENGVRRWAAALDLGPVAEAPTDVDGYAARSWSTSGYDGTGVHFLVRGYVLEPVPVTDRFGVGVGPST